MRRRFMFASALVSLTVAAPAAYADREVNTEITTPLATSTAGSGGGADNIVITSDGRVSLTSAVTAITLDSDNDVTVDGEIDIVTDDDGAVGVHVLGGNTGSLNINGDISITSETEVTDNGEDENYSDLDGPSAIGSNRIGVLVDGTGAFVGDVIMGPAGTITIEGNQSRAVSLQTVLDGNLSLDGIIQLTGDESVGIEVLDDITGDFNMLASVVTTGEGTQGVLVEGDIAGSFYLNGNVVSTGYRFAGRPTLEAYLDTLDADDRFQTGSPVFLSGSIGGGLLIDAPSATSNAIANSSIAVRGNAPAIHIVAMDRDISFGEVVQPAVEDDPDTTDVDESIAAEALGFSFVNRGAVTARGELNDISATGILIEGLDNGLGGLFSVDLTEGFWNEGSISATAFSENASTFARAFILDGGAIVPVFRNDGQITASLTSVAQATVYGDAYAIIIENDAVLNSLINDGSIVAGATGGSAYAVVDFSGELNSVVNTGTIVATHLPPQSYADDDGNVITPDDVPNSTVAVDMSASTGGVNYHQYWIRDVVEDDPDTTDVDESLDAILVTDEIIATIGDILLGSGDDTVQINAGRVEGAIAFGDGSDLFILDGTDVRDEIEALIAAGTLEEMTTDELYDELPRYIGAISDTDGQLSIQVDHASIELTQGGTLNIQDARFGDGSLLIFEIDASSNQPRSIEAAGTVTFEEGSRLTVSLSNIIGESGSYTVLSSSSLNIAEGIATLTDQPTPFLYTTSMDVNDTPTGPDTIVLTLNRKSAEDLGMTANQAAAYNAAFAGWQSNAELGEAIASLLTQSEFFNAYNQLLPEYAVSALQFARANNDITTGAIASRLEAVRRSPRDTGGLWIQEVGYFADREGTNFGPGYRGQGVGLSIGYDVPFGPFYVVGINVVGSASEITNVEGVDNPMSALSTQIGAYAGAEFLGMNLDLYAGGGLDFFEYNRQIIIGDFTAEPLAEWDGHHFNGSARLGRDFMVGRYFIRPSVGIDYLRLNESAYEESEGGDGIDLSVSERESTSFSATGMIAIGARFGDDSSWWSPQARFGYREELENDIVATEAHYVGYSDTFTLMSQQLPADGLVFGFGIMGGSDYSTFALDYDGDIRDGYVRHTARLVLRLVF